MSDEQMVFGVVKSVHIEGHEVTRFGDRRRAFVASLPSVTFAIDGMDSLTVDMPYQPDIGAVYRLQFVNGAWAPTTKEYPS